MSDITLGLWIYNKIYNRMAFQLLPGKWRGAFDYFFFRQTLASSLGTGALNGQQHRQRIVRDLLSAFNFSELIETGTFRAASTIFFARHFGGPIFTVERNPQFFHFSKLITEQSTEIRCANEDSVSFLRAHILADGGRSKERPVLFYLDAHWGPTLPLIEELEAICSYYHRPIVLIDDFQVPNDSGYRFDDYGPGKRICLAVLQETCFDSQCVFFPSLPSQKETGARRGCAVLALNKTDIEAIAKIPSLSRYLCEP